MTVKFRWFVLFADIKFPINLCQTFDRNNFSDFIFAKATFSFGVNQVKKPVDSAEFGQRGPFRFVQFLDDPEELPIKGKIKVNRHFIVQFVFNLRY